VLAACRLAVGPWFGPFAFLGPPSEHTITALRTCPAPPAKELRLTVYPGVGHDSWDHAYSGSQGQDIYGWMLGFTTG
jgi:hypothetical protein